MAAPEKTNDNFEENRSKWRNDVVQPMLTDLYQLTMSYALWKSGKANQTAVFDLFFRKNPFDGEFTIFGGLEDCIKFLEHFYFSDSDIEYLKTILPNNTELEFFDYLQNLSTKDVKIFAPKEGTVMFPRVPLLTYEGPLIIGQLIESTLLNLINYSSLIATNAARFRMAAGSKKMLLEFGLRRAQGPNGALTASKYSFIGGFDATSNVLAGKVYGIPVRGTHAHAFVSTYGGVEDVREMTVTSQRTGEDVKLAALVQTYHAQVGQALSIICSEASMGELAAFIAYANAFPNGFLALVDTYDVMRSGLINFCAVALALNDLGYRALGIRLDSGDLAYLSTMARRTFITIGEKFGISWFKDLTIVASNDINEETLYSLNEQGHSITAFGIGTHLVTCQRQPALGCVYKLVQVNDVAKMKLSEDVHKVTIPGRKFIYRLYSKEGTALVDIMQTKKEPPPKAGERLLCRHPFQESKRAYVIPARTEHLLELWWENGKVAQTLPTLMEIKEHVQKSLAAVRTDHKRRLNPTPYKVSLSDTLYNFLHQLWLANAPIGELS